MFGIRTRKLVLALSLVAAVGIVLPGSHTASAAPNAPTGAAEDARPVELVEVGLPKGNPMPIKAEVTRLPVKKVGTNTTYSFQIKAVNGPLHTLQAHLSTYYQVEMGASTLDHEKHLNYFIVPAGNTFTVSITCTDPPVGAHCTSGKLMVEGSNFFPVTVIDNTDGATNPDY